MNAFLEELFPPGIKPVQRWRIMVFAALLGLTVHVAWACGLIPGLHGFALADDVEKISGNVDTILLLSMENTIRGLAEELCRTKNVSSRHIFQEQIDRLQLQHHDMTGAYYPTSGCGNE